MKTVLFATTALVASTAFAAADVTLSGSGEMGIVGGDDLDAQFFTDIDVTFTMTGETDTGLVFGANIDLDETDPACTAEELDEFGTNAITNCAESDAFNGHRQNGESLFISGAFGTLTMGDTDGALDWALQEAIIGSAINDDHEHGGYNGNAALDGTYDGQVARYEYAFADFAIAASAEIDDDLGGDDGVDEGDPVLGLGIRYATEFSGVGLAFGAGVQTISGLEDLARSANPFDDDDNDDDDEDGGTIWGISADADLDTYMQGLRVIGNYSDLDGFLGFDDHWGLAVGYSFDAFTVAANYGRFGGDDVENDGWGLIANYDLGGGAELQAAWAQSESEFVDLDSGIDVVDQEDTYSLGIAMSF